MRAAVTINLLAVLMIPQIVWADTAEEMLSGCRAIAKLDITDGMIAIPNDFKASYCWGAFAAVQGLIRMKVASEQAPMLRVCVPAKSTRAQLVAVFVAYVERHPEQRHESFESVLLRSLWEPFPCKP
jgi:hypothetical protein